MAGRYADYLVDGTQIHAATAKSGGAATAFRGGPCDRKPGPVAVASPRQAGPGLSTATGLPTWIPALVHRACQVKRRAKLPGMSLTPVSGPCQAPAERVSPGIPVKAPWGGRCCCPVVRGLPRQMARICPADKGPGMVARPGSPGRGAAAGGGRGGFNEQIMLGCPGTAGGAPAGAFGRGGGMHV